MAVQLAREGKLNETTDAIARAAREEKGGTATRFLKNWIDAIRNINETLVKLLGKGGSKELKTLVNEINKVLDTYGVMVAEKDKAKNAPETKKETSKKEPSSKEKQDVVLPPIMQQRPEVEPAQFQTKKIEKKKRQKPPKKDVKPKKSSAQYQSKIPGQGRFSYGS